MYDYEDTHAVQTDKNRNSFIPPDPYKTNKYVLGGAVPTDTGVQPIALQRPTVFLLAYEAHGICGFVAVNRALAIFSAVIYRYLRYAL